jgi:hypothetical protein
VGVPVAELEAAAEPEVVVRAVVLVAELEAAAEPEVVVRAVVLVAELEAAAVELVEPALALAGPVVRVERVAPEAKARGEMLEAQPEEPAGRAARTTTTILMRIR